MRYILSTIFALMFLGASSYSQTLDFENGPVINSNYSVVVNSNNVTVVNMNLCNSISNWAEFDHNSAYIIIGPTGNCAISFKGYFNGNGVAKNFAIFESSTAVGPWTTVTEFDVDNSCNTYTSNTISSNKYIKLARQSSNGNMYIDNITSSNGVLPVELSYFSAKMFNGKILISWKTETEANNFGFKIQQSLDAINWNDIGFVEGYGTVNSPKNYSFIHNDENLTNHTNYYRLVQIDRDGFTTISKITSVAFDGSDITVLNVSPNPIKSYATVLFNVSIETSLQIYLYDIAGNNIQTVFDGYCKSGLNISYIDVSKMSSGTYYLTLNVNGNRSFIKTIIAK